MEIIWKSYGNHMEIQLFMFDHSISNSDSSTFEMSGVEAPHRPSRCLRGLALEKSLFAAATPRGGSQAEKSGVFWVPFRCTLVYMNDANHDNDKIKVSSKNQWFNQVTIFFLYIIPSMILNKIWGFGLDPGS